MELNIHTRTIIYFAVVFNSLNRHVSKIKILHKYRNAGVQFHFVSSNQILPFAKKQRNFCDTTEFGQMVDKTLGHVTNV